MKNLVEVRSRTLGLAELAGVDAARMVYCVDVVEKDVVWVYGGSLDSLYRMRTDLSSPLSAEKCNVSLVDEDEDGLDGMEAGWIFSVPGNKLLLVGRRGEIVLISVDSSSADLVGRIADGIGAASVSPSGDSLVLVTGGKAMLLLSVSAGFEVVREGPVESSDGSKFVSVGWGSKTTQFHGSAGKAAAVEPGTVLMRPAPHDDGQPRISWRQDGSLFAVSTVDDSSSARRIRVYDVSGELESVSEPIGMLEWNLAWMPNGSLIASTAIHPDGGRQVIFLERNGLQHGSFRLMGSDRVVWMGWSLDSEVLTVVYEGGRVEQWHRSNYHWYLKSIAYGSSATWMSGTHLLSHDGTTLKIAEYGWRYDGSRDDILSLVATIDGATVHLTPFALSNIPPPLSLHQWTSPTTVTMVDVWVDSLSSFAMAVATDDGTVHLLHASIHRGSSCTFETVWSSSYPDLKAIRFCKDGRLAIHSSTFVQFHDGPVQVEEYAIPVDACILQQDPSYYQSYDGQVFGKSGSLIARLPAFSPVVEILSEDRSVLSLSTGNLSLSSSIDSKHLLADCTFVHLTPAFVLVGQSKSIRFLPRSNPSAWAEMLSPSYTSGGEEISRRIETGSLLLTTTPSSLILQAPRGNLETVYPRALLLSTLRTALSSLAYSQAYALARRHRLDLNILYDLDPARFMGTVGLFVQQVGGEGVALFLAGLRDEDVCRTKYPGIHLGELNGDELVVGKVNRVCGAVREAIVQLGSPPHLTDALLSTYVRSSPPRLPDALRSLLALPSPTAMDRALSHLIFLVDAPTLYSHALALYHLPLALSVARRSQMDPAEYVPFLEELSAISDERVRRFRIDAHLGHHPSALSHYWAVIQSGEVDGSMDWDGFLLYCQQHSLYTHALSLLSSSQDSDDGRISQVYCLYAAAKLASGDIPNAALLYTLANDTPSALECCIQAGLVHQALSISSSPDTLGRLIATLAQQRRYKDAFNLAVSHHQTSSAVELALEGGLWLEALSADPSRSREIVQEGLKAAEGVQADIDDLAETFRSKSDRLLHLQHLIINPVKKADSEFDIADNLSTLSFRSTTNTAALSSASSLLSRSSTLLSGTSTHKNRKKAERQKMKAKPGSPFERDGLRLALHEIIAKVQQLHASIRPLLVLLSSHGHQQTAMDIQSSLLTLTTAIASFARLFRPLQDSIEALVQQEISKLPQDVLASTEGLAQDIESRHAWHQAFRLSSAFTDSSAWALPF